MLPSGRWVPRVLVVLLVGGLLLMHGVSWTHRAGAAPAASMASSTDGSHGHDGPTGTGGSPSPAPLIHVAGLCLAVLAGTGLHRLLRRGIRRPAVRLTPALSSATWPRVTLEPLHPPGLGRLALTVARC
jgi:hypothetical protein